MKNKTMTLLSSAVITTLIISSVNLWIAIQQKKSNFLLYRLQQIEDCKRQIIMINPSPDLKLVGVIHARKGLNFWDSTYEKDFMKYFKQIPELHQKRVDIYKKYCHLLDEDIKKEIDFKLAQISREQNNFVDFIHNAQYKTKKDKDSAFYSAYTTKEFSYHDSFNEIEYFKNDIVDLLEKQLVRLKNQID